MRISGGFGARVRELRRIRGLTQAELGGEAYTGSYISYLESGRRTPTEDVARYIARRLAVDPSELGIGGAASMGTDLAIASQLMVADRHLHTCEWDEALAAARNAESVARSSGRMDRAWECRFMQCRILIESEQFAEGAELAVELADDAAFNSASVVQGDALTLAARGMRSVGRLDEALQHATAALRYAPDLIRRAEALLQVVAVRAVLGDPFAEWADTVEAIEEVATQLPRGHLLGRIYWTLGNIYHQQGDIERGERCHGEAAQLITSSVDLILWSRLHRVIAHHRLLRGVTDGVAEQLAQAENAMTLTGRITDLVELWVDSARLSLMEGDLEAGLIRVRGALDHDAMRVPCPPRAAAYELLGEILLAKGDAGGARAAYRAVATDYEAMGAPARALDAWRRAATVPDGEAD